MATVDTSDNTCSVFGSIAGAEPGSLLRFVVGENTTPVPLSATEIGQQLGDPLATLLFARGRFPATAEQLLAAIDSSLGAGDPLGPASQRSFVLGEGSQLGVGPGSVESTNRGIRFLVARGSASHGPDLILSASHPQAGVVEIMAWDERQGGFNYYRNLGDSGEWVFAGNSRHGLSGPTQGKGPFESHPSGNLLMKELKFPWVHWHSFKANIFDTVFPEGDIRRSHPWFASKQGAETCEVAVVIPTIERWTSARLDRAIGPNGVVDDPGRVIQQVVASPTVNLTTSSEESAAINPGDVVNLPPSFFADVDGFEIVGLPGPPRHAVSGEIYLASLEEFDFALRDGDGFEVKGDTHFAFVVPERAFEDTETLRQSIDRGLITKRLAAALLMVDFPNPVFSARREALIRHAPIAAVVAGGSSGFSEEMAQRILDVAPTLPPNSPEQEFAELWAAGDDWPAVFAARLRPYYEAIERRLSTEEGFNAFTRLAESRRNRVRRMPIFEFRLLFPETNIPPTDLAMGPDGTVRPTA